MTTINTGGPAFPNPALADESFCAPYDMSGMTLRDYAAIHNTGWSNDVTMEYAVGFNPDPQPHGLGPREAASWWAKAEWAYRYVQADAMIAARKPSK